LAQAAHWLQPSSLARACLSAFVFPSWGSLEATGAMADRDHSRTPRGHGANGGSEDIMRVVVQREQARLQKDFSQADSFREQLGAMGVQLFDKTNSWKAADGRTGRIPTFSEVENGAGSPDAVISMMEDKVHIQPPAYSMDSEEGQIKSLVRQREEADPARTLAAPTRFGKS